MNQRLKYERCKQQTEEKLQGINDLELQIRLVQQQLDRKKKSISRLKQKNDGYDTLIHNHTFYQQQLKKLLAITTKSQSEEEADEGNKTPTTPTSGKRDLAEILGTTGEAFSKKVEQIIEQQLKSRQRASDKELVQLQQLFDRLPRNDTATLSQFSSMVETLLSEVKLLEFDERKYPADQTDYKLWKRSGDERVKYEAQYRDRMQVLKSRKEELELEAKTIERQLIRRVRELHSDPAVQSALVKNMRTKSGNQQVKAELQSVLSQIEDINKRIGDIQEENSLTEMETLISDVLRKINQKQTETQVLTSVNEEQQKRIDSIGNKIGDSNNDYEELVQTAENIKASLLNTSQSTGDLEGGHDEKQREGKQLLSNIKEILHTPYSVSDIEALSRILQTVELVRKLSSELSDDSEIEKMALQLVEKWNTALQTRNLPLPTDEIAEHNDEMLPITQHISRLKAHIDNVESGHSSRKDAKYRAKLEVADKVEEEVKLILGALQERDFIKQLGKDYTVGKKTFSEWLELLRERQ